MAMLVITTLLAGIVYLSDRYHDWAVKNSQPKRESGLYDLGSFWEWED